MDGILAIAGLILLAAGLLSLAAAAFIGIGVMTTKDPVAKAASIRSLKKTAIAAALLLLVGTGVCTLQFTLYPLKID